ncbi:PBS lyase [Desulfuromonas versatilis]|uniref:PBS lyase n=1 Tax=Desulfuromonas versatilis TaxID=2802975 RepID=A0ABM8HTF8_9BACT|nr:HEAT repeat domain-containing protein [Desulfuromonas versatilis]BCR03752.1 PBS lyase [Desulfuromonas versatilis]
MSSKLVDRAALNLDTQVLSNFIYEWNISRRHISAYPHGHPLIGKSAEKVLSLLGQLLEFRSAFTLGIAKDSLLIGNSFFDRRNPVFRDFAQALFGVGIASITVRRGLTADELYRFNRILSFSREEVRDCGGIEQALIDSGVRCIMVEQVDYDAFRATEETSVRASDAAKAPRDPGSLWDQFVKGILDGTGDSATEPPTAAALADAMNAQQDTPEAGREKQYQEAISSFISQVGAGGMERAARREVLERLGGLVAGLNPELRRQFLNSAFQSLAEADAVAEEFLGRLPDGVIIEALESVNERRDSVPSGVLNLLAKLARHGQQGKGGRIRGADRAGEGGVEEKLQVIFREEETERFVPQDYQEALGAILEAESLPPDDLEQLETLKQTLESHCVETQISSVILEVLRSGPDAEQLEVLKRSLLELAGYFLEMGDFPALLAMHHRLVGEAGEESLRREILTLFAEEEFVEQVLDSLSRHGKAKYEEIAGLIREIGEPFVNPLMNRLAEESSMSLRRYYMVRLEELGHLTRDAALRRLDDPRWYFVRNLIISLRQLNDPSVVEAVRKLRSHERPQVRQEVMRTLLHFNDAEANRILLQDLASSELPRQLTALQLAERSPSAEVFTKLLEMAASGGLGKREFELRLAVLRTLAEIGSPEALPVLGRIFNSRPLLHKKTHQRLRLEILRSLPRYPAESVTWLLEKLAGVKDPDIAREAAKTLQRVTQGRRK